MLVDADGDRILDDLSQKMQTLGANQTVDVIVRLRPGAAPDGLIQTHITPKVQWQRAINGFAAALTPVQIARLASHPEVKMVEADLPVRLFLNTATQWTGVQQARRDFKVTGDGNGDLKRYDRDDVVVAVIDTGIDVRHVDLDGGKVIGWHDGVNKLPIAYDDQGHGSHVSSIIAGTGEGDGKSVGVAPGAALVGIKVMDMLGRGTESGIISGIEWMLENKERFGIRVANLSLGAEGCADGTDAMAEAVDRAVDAGITVFVAAGNAGPGACSIGTPASSAKAITVGAAYDPGEGGWLAAEFSGRGPTKDGRIKPDIMTPGYNINAAKANSRQAYVAQSGTSMATPFAAGIAALMLSAQRDLGPDQLKTLLYEPTNFRDFGPAGHDPEFGRGILKVYSVIEKATGRTGRYADRFRHAFFSGDLGYMGHAQTWEVKVTDRRTPLAIGMVNKKWQPVKVGMGVPAFELVLLDAKGEVVAASRTWHRQEQILVKVKRAGTYTIKVRSLFGDGPYFMDVSYR